MKRIAADGTVMQEVRVEIPADLDRRMELHKAAKGVSHNLLLQRILKPVLELLPSVPATD